jgi:hypothetical protein
MENNGKPAKKKTALNVSKLSLSAPNPQVKGIYAQLKWDLWQNNPRVVVDTKDPNLLSQENGFGRIQAAMPSTDLYALFSLLRQFATNPEVDKKKCECLGHEWVNGQKNKDITPTASVWVGRDAEGHVFISVVNEAKKNFPIIKFVFGPTDQRYTKWYNADGSPMTKAQASQLYALAYANMLEALYASVLDTHYEQPVPPVGGWGNNRGGGGGGGYNRPGNGGGGGSADVPKDEDMPFASSEMHFDMVPSKVKRMARTDF